MSCENQQKDICNEKFKGIFKTIEKIEKIVENVQELTISVNNIANSIEKIVENDKEQNRRITKIENKDVDRYEYIIRIVISNIIGIAIGYLFSKGGIWQKKILKMF